jgi:hypothetical protein
MQRDPDSDDQLQQFQEEFKLMDVTSTDGTAAPFQQASSLQVTARYTSTCVCCTQSSCWGVWHGQLEVTAQIILQPRTPDNLRSVCILVLAGAQYELGSCCGCAPLFALQCVTGLTGMPHATYHASNRS